MSEPLDDDYGLSKVAEAKEIPAPELPYRPPHPKSKDHVIGVIGCGGIAGQQLAAYQHAGYRVTALCDIDESRARRLQSQFYPDAFVTADYREVLRRKDVTVVDIATHPAERVALIEAAIGTGKHVLSQKPFVTDLDVGERLADLAERNNLILAVNQNGRWAPHFSYLREAVRAGLIGEVQSVNFTLHWDHQWIIGTPFEEIHHLVLYDFAIHWFDLAAQFFQGRTAKRVQAVALPSISQRARPPFLAQAAVEYEGGMASLFFNANVVHGQNDRTFIAGSLGSAISSGPSLSNQEVTLHTAEGVARPKLDGTWFREGFLGAMGELLRAIEEGRTPLNNARENLHSLALCFAALASADEGVPKIPGEIRRKV